MNENLYSIMQSRFPADGDRWVIETVDGTVYSYGQLQEAAGRYARLLRAIGVKKGDRVAVQTDKSPQTVFFYLGCLQAGAVYVPLNVAYKRAEIEYFLGDSEPVLMVCRPESEPAIRAVAANAGVSRVLTMNAFGQGSLADAAAELAPETQAIQVGRDDAAAICYTSGTTGRSKGAVITHGNLSSNALVLHRIWRFLPGDVMLHALPIFHVHGLFVAIHTTLLNASGMLFLSKFDADEVIRLLPRATVMMGVPTFYVRLLEREDFTATLTRNIRVFVSGSAPLSKETFRRFEQRTGARILERYGMTEAGMISSNPYDEERRAGTVGFPLPDVQLRIADDQGNTLGPDRVGAVEIKGPNLFPGYWRMPDKTASEFQPDGFFVTGDLGKIDRRGYLQLVGRARELIISGGYNVYPKEIEQVIDAIPGVEESAIVGLPHPDLGEAVAAVVKRSGGADEPIGEAQIIAAVKQKLANFKAPKRVFFVPDLPRNAMGKVQKVDLQYTFRDVFVQRQTNEKLVPR